MNKPMEFSKPMKFLKLEAFMYLHVKNHNYVLMPFVEAKGRCSKAYKSANFRKLFEKIFKPKKSELKLNKNNTNFSTDWQFLYALGWKLEDLDRMIGPNWQNLFLNKPEK